MPKAAPATSFLTLGGTGVIGSAMASLLAGCGIRAVSLSLSADSDGDTCRNLQIDLKECPPAQLLAALEKACGASAPVGILDLVGLSPSLIPTLAGFAAARTTPVSVISSCLLYDHDGTRVIDETALLVDRDRTRHPYIRAKLEIEAAWQRVAACDWTIFRTHHVLGRGALLGCLPDHNRDPALLETLRAGGPLRLARGGEVRLSYIHPADFAEAVLDHGGKGALVRQIANLVHPQPVRARDYYDLICKALGIGPVPVTEARVDPAAFWSLTAKDNVFATRHDALRAHRFRHDISACITDALAVNLDDYAGFGTHMFGRISGG